MKVIKKRIAGRRDKNNWNGIKSPARAAHMQQALSLAKYTRLSDE